MRLVYRIHPLRNRWTMGQEFEADLAEIGRIPAVPAMLEVICRTTGMGFAALTRVTEDRWIACAVRDEIHFGLEAGDEVKTSTTVCHKVRQTGKAIVISDLAQDALHSFRPAPAALVYRSYISVPIVLSGGRFFGTLCAIDPRPVRLDAPETIAMFNLFAELLVFHIEALEPAAEPVPQALEVSKKFLTVLGHDLRNPLATINMSAWTLARSAPNDKSNHVVDAIHNSVVRMSGLIDNMLDFASGRLDGDIVLDRDADEPVEPVLRAVIAECHAYWPDRTIEVAFAIDAAVKCDRGRIAHLCSNLLRNALAYGAPDQPVRVRAATVGGVFELSVANAGEPLSAEAQERLLRPYVRGMERPGPHGAGLGLFVAAAIARAHGGRLEVRSTPEETCFTFRMKSA